MFANLMNWPIFIAQYPKNEKPKTHTAYCITSTLFNRNRQSPISNWKLCTQVYNATQTCRSYESFIKKNRPWTDPPVPGWRSECIRSISASSQRQVVNVYPIPGKGQVPGRRHFPGCIYPYHWHHAQWPLYRRRKIPSLGNADRS